MRVYYKDKQRKNTSLRVTIREALKKKRDDMKNIF